MNVHLVIHRDYYCDPDNCDVVESFDTWAKAAKRVTELEDYGYEATVVTVSDTRLQAIAAATYDPAWDRPVGFTLTEAGSLALAYLEV